MDPVQSMDWRVGSFAIKKQARASWAVDAGNSELKKVIGARMRCPWNARQKNLDLMHLLTIHRVLRDGTMLAGSSASRRTEAVTQVRPTARLPWRQRSTCPWPSAQCL